MAPTWAVVSHENDGPRFTYLDAYAQDPKLSPRNWAPFYILICIFPLENESLGPRPITPYISCHVNTGCLYQWAHGLQIFRGVRFSACVAFIPRPFLFS